MLVRVQDTTDVTMGGVFLPDSARERPLRCACLLGQRTCVGQLLALGSGMPAPPEAASGRSRLPTARLVLDRSPIDAPSLLPLPLLCRSGTVVRVGPGKQDGEGGRKAPKVKEGDKVIYFK